MSLGVATLLPPSFPPLLLWCFWAVVSDANEPARDVKKGIIYSSSPTAEDITSPMTDALFLQRERSKIWHPNEWPAGVVSLMFMWQEGKGFISRFISVPSGGYWRVKPKGQPLRPPWAQTRMPGQPVLKCLAQLALDSSMRPLKTNGLRKSEDLFFCCYLVLF